MLDNFAFVLPDNLNDFEKNHENAYSVKGLGKEFDKSSFKAFADDFSKHIAKDPFSIMEADNYEPAFYLMKSHTRDPAYTKILEKVLLTIRSNFHKVLNNIGDNFSMDDKPVQCFLRLMVIQVAFLNNSIVTRNEEDLLDEDGEIKKKRRRESEGHNLVELVSYVVMHFKELCFGVAFRELLRKSPGLGRLLYKGIKQAMKDSLAVYDEKVPDDQSSAVHIFQIIEELIELEAIRVYNLQYDLGTLINDIEICGKTVGSFLILCSRSKKPKIFELASSTLINIVKKHCMTKGRQASESSSVRYYRQFFEYLAPELYDIFHTHLNEFLYLFDSQCYPLRCALTEILKQIIINKFGQFEDAAKDEELGSNNETLRKELLDWILQRTRDKSSFARAKALSDLNELMVLKMIHKDYIEKVFERAAMHIRDNTSSARKKAMILCSEIISYYLLLRFPEEETVAPELADIRMRKAEFEKMLETDPNADRDYLTDQILTAMKYESLLVVYQNTYNIFDSLVPQIVSLMFRNSQDSLEAIRLLVKMKTLGYHKIDAHFPKMFTLVWSEDAAITKEIKASFISLYVNKERKQNACRNICALLKICDISTRVCVLRVIGILFEDSEKNKKLDAKSKSRDVLEEEFIPLFWNYFQERFENARTVAEEEEYRLSLKVIAEGLVFYPKWFYSFKKQDIIYLMRLYLSKQKKVVDWEVISDLCRIISRTKAHFNNNESSHFLILKSIEEIIVMNLGTNDPGWYKSTQSFIQAVFDVSKCPEIYIEIFFKKIAAGLGQFLDTPFDMLTTRLTQLVWTAGEVALKLLIRVEDVEELLKKKNRKETNNSEKKIEEQEELDQAMGGFDSVYQSQRDILHEISNNQIIYDNMIGSLLPLVQGVVKQIVKHKNDLAASPINTALAHCCVATLFKFSAVSYKFCQEIITTIMDLISRDIDPALVVKSLLGLGDLVKRFPQVVEPFGQRLFETLESPHKSVKKISMIIITHLILNDMLKIKGEIVDIITRLADEDTEIRRFTELFMAQLHKKDPMIINNLLPDTLSRFSQLDAVTPALFERFAHNLLGFVDKERQATMLADNLVQRFKATQNTKELIFISICLSIIANNLSVFKVLESNSDAYLDRLGIPEIGKNFQDMIEKLKAATTKGKAKKGVLQQIEALEEKMKPFLEMRPGERHVPTGNIIDVEGSQQPIRRVQGNSAVSPAPGTDQRSKKKNGKNRKPMDAEEDSSSRSVVQQHDEEDPNVLIPQRKRNIIMDEDDEQVSRPKTRATSKKQTQAQDPHSKSGNKKKPTASKKKHRKPKIDEEDEEDEDELPDDDDDEEYTN